MPGRRRASVIFALGLPAAAALSCAHAGPTRAAATASSGNRTSGCLTVTAKVTAAPQWKLDEDGNPSPASFGGDGVGFHDHDAGPTWFGPRSRR